MYVTLHARYVAASFARKLSDTRLRNNGKNNQINNLTNGIVHYSGSRRWDDVVLTSEMYNWWTGTSRWLWQDIGMVIQSVQETTCRLEHLTGIEAWQPLRISFWRNSSIQRAATCSYLHSPLTLFKHQTRHFRSWFHETFASTQWRLQPLWHDDLAIYNLPQQCCLFPSITTIRKKDKMNVSNYKDSRELTSHPANVKRNYTLQGFNFVQSPMHVLTLEMRWSIKWETLHYR